MGFKDEMSMDIEEAIISFLLLTHLSFIVSSTEICSASACVWDDPLIRFPFSIQNFHPKNCGFSGFNISCDREYQTILQLPNSGPFTVQLIDYAKQEILINDPNDCLPLRLLTLNLSASPFRGVYYQDFALFNCSFDYRKYGSTRVGCLSGMEYSVFATSSAKVIKFFSSSSCGLISNLSVPVPRGPSLDRHRVFSTDLSDGIRLTWDAPDCRRCESRGGLCGFKLNSTTEIECRNVPHGLPKGARYAIYLGAGVPAFLCLIGLLCFVFVRVQSCARRSYSVRELPFSVTPRPIVIMSGLDRPTIESYPRTVLGESCHLPMNNDNACSICLSDYRPKDTLRSMPFCQHWFHAECIDEWLRLNASCPLCRNSPALVIASRGLLVQDC